VGEWKMASLGVLADRKALEKHWRYGLNVFGLYVGELLTDTGIPWQLLDDISLVQIDRFDIVIVVCTAEDEASARHLAAYAEQGGIVIGCGGLNEIARRLGAIPGPAYASGYAHLPAALGDSRPLRFVSAQPWTAEPAAAEASGRLTLEAPDGAPFGAALQTFALGGGFVHRWAVDIPATIVALQQGYGPVLGDGIPAPDGSAAIDDGLWKADDRIALSWEYDRAFTETGQPYFARPYADLWRDALIGHLLRTASAAGLVLPFVEPWPDGIRQVAMISHDSDLNADEAADATLRALGRHGIQSTWCMLEPGYSRPVYERIRADGHELAFHYNAVHMEDRYWDEADFRRQLAWCREATGAERIVSNKNHYTRFEGWGELFAWCEAAGIRSDQTRGPSKRGNVGFLFGTCRPYVPMAWWEERNRMYDVLEIGFLTQDLGIGAWADTSVIVPFLEQTAAVRGVAHFLCHQHYFHTRPAELEAALDMIVEEARKRKFVFWTGAQIDDWVRARRGTKITGIAADSGQPLVEGGNTPEGLVVWIPLPMEGANASATDASAQPIEYRYNHPCIRYRRNPEGSLCVGM